MTAIPPELGGYTLTTSTSFMAIAPEQVRIAKDGWFVYQTRSFIEMLIEDGAFEQVMDSVFADMKRRQPTL